MKYLLDTMVVSEPTKRKRESRVIEWLKEHAAFSAVSILALGEVERGIIKLPDGVRRKRLMTWFVAMADGMDNEGRVIGISRELMSSWAVTYNREERLTKRKPPFVDTLMAATAEVHGMTMVTRNVKDFPTGLPVINPWDA